MKAQVQSHTCPRTISGGQRGTGIVFLLALQCLAISIIPPVLHTHISLIRHRHYIFKANASFVQENKKSTHTYTHTHTHTHTYIYVWFLRRKETEIFQMI
jgi:hypothetical protein